MATKLSLTLLAAAGLAIGQQPTRDQTSLESIAEKYDYVVVGGGTSGLVVANRLSEDPKSKKRHHSVYLLQFSIGLRLRRSFITAKTPVRRHNVRHRLTCTQKRSWLLSTGISPTP